MQEVHDFRLSPLQVSKEIIALGLPLGQAKFIVKPMAELNALLYPIAEGQLFSRLLLNPFAW